MKTSKAVLIVLTLISLNTLGFGQNLLYSTFLGDSGMGKGSGIAVDSTGIYVVGFARENPYVGGRSLPMVNSFQPSNAGRHDAFIVKLNPNGSDILWSTYLGGSGEDYAWGIALDGDGNVYVVGITHSNNFPTKNAFQSSFGGGRSDAFVAKFDTNGNLLFSTYFGGSGAAWEEAATSIAVTPAGNAFVTGYTDSADLPILNAFQPNYNGGMGFGDAFVIQLDPTGSLIYSTYLGGSEADAGFGVAVNATGNAFVVGYSSSYAPAPKGYPGKPFPTAPGTLKNKCALDWLGRLKCLSGFVAGLNSTGNPTYSTFFDGTSHSMGIAIDPLGTTIYLASTASERHYCDDKLEIFGRSNNRVVCSDARVIKLNPEDSTEIYSIKIAGNGHDFIKGITVDAEGNTYITGFTSSFDFPTVNAFQKSLSGIDDPYHHQFGHDPPGDAFVTNLDPNGNIIYSSYLGGHQIDNWLSGGGITVDHLGNVYVTGWAGATFPIRNPLPDSRIGGTFVAKIGKNLETPINPPVINTGGVVNAASFAPGVPLAPGSLASAFGNNLNVVIPPYYGLSMVKVRMNDFLAPVVAATPAQINFQVPWELSGVSEATLTVTDYDVTSSPVTVPLAMFSPGLFSIDNSGKGQGAILIANTSAGAAPVGTRWGWRPANRGEWVSIYATGLGPVTNQPPTGVKASSDPLSLTTVTPLVTIGGIPAEVNFSGLAPGFFGLYQVNARVPMSAPTGDAIPVVLTIGGATSNTVTIAVQ